MAATLIQELPPYDIDNAVGNSVGLRWKTWLADFEMFMIANAITGNNGSNASRT